MGKRSVSGSQQQKQFNRLRRRVEALCEGLSRLYPDLTDQELRSLAHRVVPLIQYDVAA